MEQVPKEKDSSLEHFKTFLAFGAMTLR